jgi:hypothetical protein
MQLRWRAAVVCWLLAASGTQPRAEDRIDFTTTWFQERRRAAKGLTVVHPQLSAQFDLGETAQLSLGYATDAVSGATAAVYSVDAISTATEFSDVRHEARLGTSFTGKRSSLSIGVQGGVERDYTSLTVSGSASADLPGKNTSFALVYSHGFDQVCDRDNSQAGTPLERRALTGVDPCDKTLLAVRDRPGQTRWQELDIDTIDATVTQNLTPTAALQLAVFGQVLRGFQANPYRRVRLQGTEPQENMPGVRGRLALLARINKFLPAVRSALHAHVRGYSDTWGVDSLTLEMGYSQYFGQALLFRLRGRVYQQTEATFFKDAFFYEAQGTAGAYFTGDRELAPLRHVTSDARLSYLVSDPDGNPVWGVFDEARLDLHVELMFFEELPAGDERANFMGTDRQFLTSDQFLDALMLAASVHLRF